MPTSDTHVRAAVHPEAVRTFATADLRAHFLVTTLFEPGGIGFVYTHYDRVILLGISPLAEPLSFGPDLLDVVREREFLARRECGIINLGGRGRVMADGVAHELGRLDGLYLGRGTSGVSFESADPAHPALFYANAMPAHARHPTVRRVSSEMQGDVLGAQETANKRVLTKVFHPGALETCQLVMGYTRLEPGNVWNTMPPHTHDRRMEAYLYFDLKPDAAVVHLMGEPQSTQHLIVRDMQAIISPPWSIHSGCGTSNYGFVWSMAGDNQEFTDMDAVPVSALL